MPEHQQIQQSKKPDTTFQKQATPVSQTPVSNPYSIIQRARINPRSLTRADIMQLQRTIGNQAVGMLLSSIGNSSTAQQTTVQRQEIPEEEEPLQGKMSETVQRQEIPEEEEPLQGKMIGTVQRQEITDEEEPLQGKFAEPIQRQEIPEEEEPLQTKRENNTGMPDNLKAGVENLSGIDMSDVRVHYNSDKPAEVGALAYTQGTDIHVAPGQERHLPHEAWHVVQQVQGRVRPTMQMKDGVPVNDDEGLEHEADVMGENAAATFVRKSSKETSIIPNKYETGSITMVQRVVLLPEQHAGINDNVIDAKGFRTSANFDTNHLVSGGGPIADPVVRSRAINRGAGVQRNTVVTELRLCEQVIENADEIEEKIATDAATTLNFEAGEAYQAIKNAENVVQGVVNCPTVGIKARAYDPNNIEIHHIHESQAVLDAQDENAFPPLGR